MSKKAGNSSSAGNWIGVGTALGACVFVLTRAQLFDLFRIDISQPGGVTHRVLLRPKTLNRRRLSLLRGRGTTGVVRTWCHVFIALHGA